MLFSYLEEDKNRLLLHRKITILYCNLQIVCKIFLIVYGAVWNMMSPVEVSPPTAI